MVETSANTPLDLKYTICFCRVNGKILMVYRYREPNKDLWNGLGGKLEPGEKAKESIIREVKEEAGIDISKANDLFFAGIVTWNKEDARVGMYAFVADLPNDFPMWSNKKETPEGLLVWKNEAWAGDTNNNEVVNNIPHFLPPMLRKEKPVDYYFIYNHHDLIEFKTVELPSEVVIE